MKILMVFDQTQAGLDGKESPDLAIGGKPMAIGSCHMFEKTLTDMEGNIYATLYCDDRTFTRDPDTNEKRFAAMSKKLNPGAVICGPCFSYGNYGEMAAETAQTISKLANIPAFAIMSGEHDAAIDEFKDHVTILKMPRKGSAGLPQNLTIMCEFALRFAKKENVNEIIREHTYQ